MNKTYYIYKHTNLVNRKVYIGQTMQDVKIRFASGHGYKNNKHFNSAIKKYGWDNFSHEILLENLSADEATLYEGKFITEFRSSDRNFGYNKSSGGEQPSLNEETKKKYAERLRKMAELRKGTPMSEEQKIKISNSRKGKCTGVEHPFYKRVLSFEEMERLRIANTGRKSAVSKSVVQLDLDNNILKIYPSALSASRELNIDTSTITKCCKNKRKSAGGFIWRYYV